MTETPTTEQPKAGSLPPYLPWKTFTTGINAIKTATVPNVLDNTAKPPNMAGNAWRAFVQATKFFELVSTSGATTERFEQLVDAYKTDAWKSAVKELLVPCYEQIVEGIPIDNGTAGTLDTAFKTKGRTDNQVLRKAVRFYLHVLTEASIPYSSRFSMRREGASGGKARKKKEVPAKAATTNNSQDETPADPPSPKEPLAGVKIPQGMLSQPVPFMRKDDKGNSTVTLGLIIFPKDLTAHDCQMIEAQVGVLRLLVGDAKS